MAAQLPDRELLAWRIIMIPGTIWGHRLKRVGDVDYA